MSRHKPQAWLLAFLHFESGRISYHTFSEPGPTYRINDGVFFQFMEGYGTDYQEGLDSIELQISNLPEPHKKYVIEHLAMGTRMHFDL